MITINTSNVGQEIYDFAASIFPYCRSITGAGVRKTLATISDAISGDTAISNQGGGVLSSKSQPQKSQNIKLNIKSVPSGTAVFDWTVPKEWKIRDAYIETENGTRLIDFKNNNLHVMGYSTPIDKWVNFAELKEHIYTQPDQPDVIPYVTSYYKERFGFCMSQRQLSELEKSDTEKPGKYHMFIDSELFDGVLNYGELLLPGESEKEIFFSTYICHPSMANNECSGPSLAVALIKYVASLPIRRYSYRFIFIPETIGSLTYLATEGHLAEMKRKIIAGFNLSCVGDNRAYSIVESRYGNTIADRVLRNVLRFHTNNSYSRYSFLARGSDERQYNAPGIDLPVVCFCRSKFGEYPEYHTSADDMGLVSPEGFQRSFDVMTEVITALEGNRKYRVTVKGEPQLGKRGLYPTVSQKGAYGLHMLMVKRI